MEHTKPSQASVFPAFRGVEVGNLFFDKKEEICLPKVEMSVKMKKHSKENTEEVLLDKCVIVP